VKSHPGAALARCAAVVLGLFLWLGGAGTAAALTQQQALSIAAGDSEARIAALNAAVAAADPALAAYVQALLADEVKVAGERAYIVRDGQAIDAATGAVRALPEGAEDVLNNNRMRRELGAAAAAMQLLSSDRAERARGIAELRSQADESKLPLIDKAAAVETDEALKEQLELLRAAVGISSADKARRLEAATLLAGSRLPATRALLLERQAEESDADVKAAIRASLAQVERRLLWGEWLVSSSPAPAWVRSSCWSPSAWPSPTA